MNDPIEAAELAELAWYTWTLCQVDSARDHGVMLRDQGYRRAFTAGYLAGNADLPSPASEPARAARAWRRSLAVAKVIAITGALLTLAGTVAGGRIYRWEGIVWPTAVIAWIALVSRETGIMRARPEEQRAEPPSARSLSRPARYGRSHGRIRRPGRSGT
jgi:hypothetical protein